MWNIIYKLGLDILQLIAFEERVADYENTEPNMAKSQRKMNFSFSQFLPYNLGLEIKDYNEHRALLAIVKLTYHLDCRWQGPLQYVFNLFLEHATYLQLLVQFRNLYLYIHCLRM
jgi:hypothetical protein